MPQLRDKNRQLMRKNRNSAGSRRAPTTVGTAPRLLLHTGPGLRRAIEPDEIYFVEAAGDDTRVRTRAGHALRDVRPMAELARILGVHGFVRTHRTSLVNPAHVREVRLRRGGEDWELRLDPPVNVVLPVSRAALRALWAAFGEE
jgi:DNA-binding LytR/AlgR family response regulator